MTRSELIRSLHGDKTVQEDAYWVHTQPCADKHMARRLSTDKRVTNRKPRTVRISLDPAI
jgi:hypothetical protein